MWLDGDELDPDSEEARSIMMQALDEAENGQPHSTVDPYRGY